MNENNQCPKCGQPVPQNAPEGLCPRCLGALNLDSETGVTGAGGGTATPPPSATELAPHFPQLEILEVLGRGGMGVVYKVRQKELDRIAALKILPPGIGGDPAFAERFAREAKALARLNHPGIVTIYDSGRTDGLYYFLMEFVDGVSLGRLMRGGRVSPREALAIVPQICDSLQYAHDQGIVHRDIKPENILLDRQGRVKVADFGLAKLVAGTQEPLPPSRSPLDGARVAGRPVEGRTPALTDAGKVMGTPAYMAPEQAEHPAAVDHRADIYALGIVFYQMLTGELPGQRLEPPSKKVHIDVRLDEVVLRTLEKEPERRYQQVSEVRTAVETIIHSAAPDVQPAPARTESGDVARRRLGPPASALLWLGALQLLLSLVVTVRGFDANSVHQSFGLFGYWRLFVPAPWAPALVVLAPYLRTLSLLVVLGACRMRRLESYGLAVTAAVLAMITPPLLPIGLPLGVWALILLARKEVRQEFGRPVLPDSSTPLKSHARFSKLAIASVILTVVSILTSWLETALGLVLVGAPQTNSAGLLARMLSSVFLWMDSWPALGTALLAAVALEDIRCGRRCLKGAGLATFGLLSWPLGEVGHIVWLRQASAPLNAQMQWAGYNLLSMLLGLVLSAGAAFWVQAHERRRGCAGSTGAAKAWWLLSRPTVRCLQVLAFALLVSQVLSRPGYLDYLRGHWEEVAGSRVQAPVPPPTVEQILAHYAQARGSMAGPDKTRTLAVKGTFTSRDRLGTMAAEMLIKAPDKWTQILKNTKGTVWQRAFDGSVAWEASPWSGPAADPASVALAPYLIALVRGDSLAPLLPKLSFKGREPIGGGEAYVVEVAVLDQSPQLWFDTQTGLLVRIECRAGSAVLQMDWNDYRDVGGLMVPFKVREAGTENWTIQCREIKLNEPIDDAVFARPAKR